MSIGLQGTWTPTLGGTSALQNIDATYTKIDNVVHISAKFYVLTLGTGSITQITGLYYAASHQQALSIGDIDSSSTAIVSANMYISGSTITIKSRTAASKFSASNAIFSSSSAGTTITFSGTYTV